MLQDKVIDIFIKADDFCNEFEVEYSKKLLKEPSEKGRRNRNSGLSDSEIIIYYRSEVNYNNITSLIWLKHILA